MVIRSENKPTVLTLYFGPGSSSMAVHKAMRKAVRRTLEIEAAIGYELPQ
ncbi:MAG: hypothetical protein ACHQAQ_18995 [Hyphomicrobiales bacterium]